MPAKRFYTSLISQRSLLIGVYAASNSIFQKSTANESNAQKDNDNKNINNDNNHAFETNQMITNWSGTHTCHPKRIYYPNSSLEVQEILNEFQKKNEKIRVVGTALSPNGIGMTNDKNGNLLSVAHLDDIIVDVDKLEVTVGAGCTVNNVLKELKKHGLTLQNFSSIQEQQMAGWTQVAAHGTGSSLPTVDEMITSMDIVTPAFGLTRLNTNEVNSNASSNIIKNKELFFNYAKVALGSLGVVTQLTLKCIPEIHLREETTILDRMKIDNTAHIHRLKSYRHVRYMWIPYTNTVVNVVSNPNTTASSTTAIATTESMSTGSTDTPTSALVDLALSISSTDTTNNSDDDMKKKSFSQLRDLILDHAPLDTDHIKRTNKAEAQYWVASQGTRTDSSTNILGFDCGGEQWVYEVCIPLGSLSTTLGSDTNSHGASDVSRYTGSHKSISKDIEFVQRLLALIEENNIPAPSPIEQRWSASSRAYMSPAYSPNKDDVFTWVGIIMYLPPSQTTEQRDAIAARFREYCKLIDPLVKEYNGYPHWAKIELPEKKDDLIKLKQYLRQKYPVDQFNEYRHIVDPNNILSNELVDSLFNSDIDNNDHK